MGSNEDGPGLGSGVWGLNVRLQSQREVGRREGRNGEESKERKFRNIFSSLKKMSCRVGLDNYCHLWDVSVQENQIIMMS